MTIKLIRHELPSWFGKGSDSWRDTLIVKQVAGFQALEREPDGKLYIEILVQARKHPIENGIKKRQQELYKLLNTARRLRNSTK
jgi:hypothetical protein